MVASPDAEDATSAAFADIRLAEAARLLGVLQPGQLADRATNWLAAGIDTANVAALAQSAQDAAGIRLALVAEIAAELGISFSTPQDARRLYSEHLTRATSGSDFGAEICALSNGFTDEVVARVRALLGRMLRPHD